MDAFDHIADGTISFLGTALWIAIVSAAILWSSSWIRGRVRRIVDRRGADKRVVTVVDHLVRVTIYLVVGLLILAAVSGDTGSVVLAVGLVLAAIALSLQDVMRNFASGLYLLIERPFEPGDSINVKDQTGEVERIDLRMTVIRNADQEEVFVPNLTVLNEVLRRKPGFEPHTYVVQSDGPAHESFEGIWEAVGSVKSVENMSPTVKIIGTKNDNVDFEVTIWEPDGDSQSAAFIAALKSNLPDASVHIADE